MTVINMLSLGEAGLAVADEQSSNRIRRYNVAQKLHLLNSNSVVYGGSGPSDLVKEIYDLSIQRLKESGSDKKISSKEIYHLIVSIISDYRNCLKDNLLKSTFGFGIDDFLTGNLIRANKPIDRQIMDGANSVLREFRENCSIQILLGGIEDSKFCIYEVNSEGSSSKISRPYATIGSGGDESDKILSSYISHLPRIKRDNIERVEGLSKILEATNASSRLNIGVGGIPLIFYVSKDGVKIPEENQCILASEIVEGLTNYLLDKNFAYESLSKLIFESEDFGTIEEEIRKRAKDWKKLDLVLRGYKI